MATIQEQLLFTTLRIERLDAQGNVESIGTGFLLTHQVGKDAYKVYLISNKHVLAGAASIAITFTKSKDGEADVGNAVRLPIANVAANVVGHPDPDVDIAILTCTDLFNLLPNQLYFKAASYDMLAVCDSQGFRDQRRYLSGICFHKSPHCNTHKYLFSIVWYTFSDQSQISRQSFST